MVGVIYNCPCCGMSCLHGVSDPDDVISLTNLLPIRLACWSCRRDNLIVLRDRALPPQGFWDTLPAHAVRIAEACSRRAVATEEESQRRFFLKMEWCWRRMAERSNADHTVALVGACTRRLSTSAIRRIA
jgi:hypothetical protein